jgi:multidrug efflux pump subunit AcrA (membrane-fusion protein)
MNPSKGPRAQVLLRIPEEARERLRSYRDAHDLDGLGDVVLEFLALRGDRDRELEEARAQARLAQEQYEAALAVVREKEREVRALRKAGLRRRVRREATAPMRLPSVESCACGGVLDLPRDISPICQACRHALVERLEAATIAGGG